MIAATTNEAITTGKRYLFQTSSAFDLLASCATKGWESASALASVIPSSSGAGSGVSSSSSASPLVSEEAYLLLGLVALV